MSRSLRTVTRVVTRVVTRALVACTPLLVGACPDDQPSPAGSGSSTSSEPTITSATSTSTTDATTTSSASTTTDGDSTTTGAMGCEPMLPSTSDCCCFDTDADELSVIITNSCPVVRACDHLEIQCPAGDPSCPLTEVSDEGELWVDDEDTLECILTALRDGTEGSLEWTFTGASTPGFVTRRTRVHVLPDRAAITDTLEILDLGGPWSDVTLEGLGLAPDFDACLNATELSDRVACLVSPTDGMVAEVCTEGGYYDALI